MQGRDGWEQSIKVGRGGSVQDTPEPTRAERGSIDTLSRILIPMNETIKGNVTAPILSLARTREAQRANGNSGRPVNISQTILDMTIFPVCRLLAWQTPKIPFPPFSHTTDRYDRTSKMDAECISVNGPASERSLIWRTKKTNRNPGASDEHVDTKRAAF